MKKIQNKVNEKFLEAFGDTPLAQRLEDIFGEAIELYRYTNLRNIKEETGDLLASLLQLCNECEWDYEELVQATLDKIDRRKLQYKSLGRKVKVALLGGAFNPPTKGHIQLAQFVLDSSRTFDEVWLMPCYQHMYSKEMVSSEQRLEMCELAAKADGRIKVFDYEIRNQLSGETYHLVKRLLGEKFAKDQYDFSFIISMDNANTFDKWVNYEYLERLIRFVVVPRAGVKKDENVNWYLKEPHIYLGNNESSIIETSSTQVREILKTITLKELAQSVTPPNIMELQQFVSNKVIDYILNNNIYLEKK